MTEAIPLTKAERKTLKKQQKQEQEARKQQRQGFKRWLLSGMGVLTVFGIGWLIYNGMVPIPESEKDKPVDRVLETDWYKGDKGAPIVIVEYSDFQCPSCKVYQPELEEVFKTYPGQVVLVYRHFPLKQIHLQAEQAAYAAEAAGRQGKFWEMHDKLFEHQAAWVENRSASRIFADYAQQIGLNMDQYRREVKHKEVKAAVKADYMSALKNALSATPSFFVNGELVVNPEGAEGFKQIIVAKLLEATASGQDGR